MTLFGRMAANVTRWLAPRRFGRVNLTANDGSGVLLNGPADVSSSLQCAAVWACVRLIAEAISALPGHIFRTTLDGKAEASTHLYYRLLTTQPNPLMTMPLWLETIVVHLMLYGNAYILPEFIEGEVVALWPIPPERVQVVIPATGSYVYRVADPAGRVTEFQPLDIMHIRLFTLDGIMGLSPIEYHRLAFQIDGLTRLYSAALYTNSGRPSGVLEVPGNLSKEQQKAAAVNWNVMHAGPSNVGRVAVLEGGMTYKPLAVPPEQLQFIQQQKYSVENIARIFGVPPHLVGAMDKPTYASVEMQALEFVQYRLQPIVTNLERTIQAALLDPPFFYKLNLSAFERSDIKTRYAAYATGRQWGWLSVNDIRRLEDLNSIGAAGDTYLQPLNMIPAPEPGEEASNGLQGVSAAGV